MNLIQNYLWKARLSIGTSCTTHHPFGFTNILRFFSKSILDLSLYQRQEHL